MRRPQTVIRDYFRDVPGSPGQGPDSMAGDALDALDLGGYAVVRKVDPETARIVVHMMNTVFATSYLSDMQRADVAWLMGEACHKK